MDIPICRRQRRSFSEVASATRTRRKIRNISTVIFVDLVDTHLPYIAVVILPLIVCVRHNVEILGLDWKWVNCINSSS